MADHHYQSRRQGKAPIYSSQVPGHSPKGSYSSYNRGTTAACTTKQVAVGDSALTERLQTEKQQLVVKERVFEERVFEERVFEGRVFEKRVFEKRVFEEKEAHKPKEATSGKKHGHHHV